MKTFSEKFEQNANLQLRKVTRAIDLYVKNVYAKTLNYKKTHFYGPKSKKIITGISISSGSPMLPRQTKRAWRQEINMIQKFGLLKHMENTKQLNPLFIPSLKGKLLFWKHIEPTNKFIDKGFIVLDEALKELD